MTAVVRVDPVRPNQEDIARAATQASLTVERGLLAAGLGREHDRVRKHSRPTANRPLIGRLVGVNRSFPGCDGARQRVTHVAAPFADTFLLGDVTVAHDRVQPRLARCPPTRAYAVVRRTRRRGGAGRGLAGCARPRGVACACCAR